MKKIILLAFSVCVLFADAQTNLRLITYNIRYDNAGDSINQWSNRKQTVANLIKKYNPSIFSVPEGLYNQVQDLCALLPAYKYVGVGRG
jgi:hypothetical protein